MALKFSTGAKDSLHPELVRAGFTPEDATATLAALGKYLGAKAIKASINADLPLGKSLGRKG